MSRRHPRTSVRATGNRHSGIRIHRGAKVYTIDSRGSLAVHVDELAAHRNTEIACVSD